MFVEYHTWIFLLLELLLDDGLGLHERSGFTGLRAPVYVLGVHSELVLLAGHETGDGHCGKPDFVFIIH